VNFSKAGATLLTLVVSSVPVSVTEKQANKILFIVKSEV
jgi:hypothetical protein